MLCAHIKSDFATVHDLGMADEQAIQRFAVQYHLLHINILRTLVFYIDDELFAIVQVDRRAVHRRAARGVLV